MSGLLLDTNALLWTLTGDARLGRKARKSITAAGVVKYSAVSVLEITVKTMLGKLSLPGDLPTALTASGLGEIPLTSRHAGALTEFAELARHDPFDRMLLAQAHVEHLSLLTSDGTLLGLGLPWVTDAHQ